MHLLSLAVSNFGCVRSASVEFCPGLNVLYGANDLGKSTLAAALRTGLLVQHSSRVALEWQPWGSDETPAVSIVFQTEPGRIWRVKKQFGTGARGMSTLESSRDGQTFTMDAKAREVDARVRELLGWGIAAPGGHGAPRGLPTTFLSTVVLGEQVDVTGILQQTLEADTDESARERLTAALSAFAQNPLFKHILEESQGKVDEAFTAKGLKKRGKTSPFAQPTADVRRAKKALDELDQSVRSSVEIEERCREHAEALDLLVEERIRHEQELAELQGRAAQGSARQAVVAELEAARAAATPIRQALAAVTQSEADLGLHQVALDAAAQTLDQTTAAVAAVATEMDAAIEARNRLQSNEVELERTHRVHQIGAEKSSRELVLQQTEVSLVSAREAVDLTQKAAAARGQLEAFAVTNKEAEGEHQTLVAATETAAAELKLYEAAKRKVAFDTHTRTIEAAHMTRKEAEAARCTAQQSRDEARALQAQSGPDRALLTEISTLQRELKLAEAGLGGGLSVRVALTRPIEVVATVDGVERPPTEAGFELDADAAVQIAIGEIASISVSAGDREARQAVATLHKRWESEAVPRLASAGVADLEGLEEAVVLAEGRISQADTLMTTAVALEREAAYKLEQVANTDAVEAELAALGRELEAVDLDPVHALLATEPDLRALRTRAERRQTEHRQRITALEGLLRDASGHEATQGERVRQAEAALEALDRPIDGWRAEVSRLEGVRDGLTAEIETLRFEMAGIEKEQASALQVAIDAVKAATDRHARVKEGVVTAAAAHQSTVAVLATTEGRLAEQRRIAATLDLPAAELAVSEVAARLAAMEGLDAPLQPAVLDRAAADLKRAEQAVVGQRALLLKARGALETVGGTVIKDQRDLAGEALLAAERREREVEVEYDAWKLLMDMLREAENTDGVHLGNALGGVLSTRFQELTKGRYGRLELDPHLEVAGLFADGTLREIRRLSAGTQDQLATLLRLTVAEQLQSTVVLDDHLAQSDEERAGWFRKVLREHAEKSQVVVLTCRPSDYIKASELPAEGTAVADRAGGLLRCIDLASVIDRA